MTLFWRHFKCLRIVIKFRGSYCDCNTITNQAGIMLDHEQTFHLRFAYKQVRRKPMQLRCVTSHDHIWYKSRKSHLKNQTRFFDNTATFMTLTAQILVLQPHGQLGYLNSNVMLRWDGHFNMKLSTAERN